MHCATSERKEEAVQSAARVKWHSHRIRAACHNTPIHFRSLTLLRSYWIVNASRIVTVLAVAAVISAVSVSVCLLRSHTSPHSPHSAIHVLTVRPTPSPLVVSDAA